MTTLHKARFYEPLPEGKVLCTLCPHDCRIPEGGRGVCAVRYNVGGRLYTLVYDRVVARWPVSAWGEPRPEQTATSALWRSFASRSRKRGRGCWWGACTTGGMSQSTEVSRDARV